MAWKQLVAPRLYRLYQGYPWSWVPTSGTTVLGPPRSADPLTELPRHITSSNTSSKG
ncbi:UNVERIFIED_CONTAM: hypothetical protein Sradi_0765700 [Sesamum radiatum]|uniref:Uncharacterized protein n=1 Tax=Sesamum radiatum TaxID=300843 RepID=A0AAW2VPH1_SESRA